MIHSQSPVRITGFFLQSVGRKGSRIQGAKGSNGCFCIESLELETRSEETVSQFVIPAKARVAGREAESRSL